MNETTPHPPDPTPGPGLDERTFVLGAQMRATILTSGEESGGRFDVTDSTRTPGARTPLHLHTSYEERVYVLEGTLTVWLGDVVRHVGPGDYVTIPTHVPHTIEAGQGGVRALNISSPPGFAELVARVGIPEEQATEHTDLDLDLLARVAAELGDVVLGPPGTVPADLDADAAARS
ncbi:hypothetical protein DSY14_00005 [Nocardiopsis sp. MG754419]|nr:hypothetical protein [Nocardiopsis sp. MG754419]